jgi:ribosomal protein L3 glutamine methyltransferase
MWLAQPNCAPFNRMIAVPDSPTVEQLIRDCAARLEAAQLCFGHGSDNAFDEAAELVFFAAGLKHEDAAQVYSQVLSSKHRDAALALVRRRIDERIPAAYLTKRMWFCGYEFYVDERVLVPRSPIAELIEAQFAPWIDPDEVHRILDIGTGSGCIAIAAAHAFPDAMVDATDVSQDALDVAWINIGVHKLAQRVRAVQSDVFSGVPGLKYDVLVSNPPYVSAAEVAALPAEYGREPQLGLLAGEDGLSIVRRILSEAERHLTPRGILIVEVGDTEETLANAYPAVPFTWLEFERGGGGVFVLTAEQLEEHRADLSGSDVR